MNLAIRMMVLGPVQTNCYFLINEDTKEVLIVDPADRAQKIIEWINSEGLKPVAILLTHGHFDHIMGIDTLRREWSVPVYASALEQKVLTDANVNLSVAYGAGYVFADAKFLEDGASLALAGYQIRMISTPGHTAGGCCYYIEEEEVLFSGDTLFAGSVGRTDFPTGRMSTLVRSVKERLLSLPEDTQVYPGHMEATTIGFEKENNPFL
mgnify:CR=1 FL=1